MVLNESTPRKSRIFFRPGPLFRFSLDKNGEDSKNPETADTFHVVILVSMLKPTFATPVNIQTWTHFNLITYQINE